MGKVEETYSQSVQVKDVNWVSIDPIQEPISVIVKLRYSHVGVKATVIPEENHSVRVKLEKPERAATPGQAAVFYQDDTLLGSLTLEETLVKFLCWCYKHNILSHAL